MTIHNSLHTKKQTPSYPPSRRRHIHRPGAIVVKIMGGLGNQFFQYAYARMLKESGYSVTLDIQTFYQEDNYNPETIFRDYLLDNFETTIPPADMLKSIYRFVLHGFKHKNRFIRKIYKLLFYFWHKKHIVNCDGLNQFDPNLLAPKKLLYIRIFPKRQIFHRHRRNIKKGIKTQKTLTGNFYYDLISSHEHEHTIAMHIRRSDYCGSGNELPLKYYQNAVDHMAGKINSRLLIFIFSDDLEYVKENFSFPHQTFFVNEDRSLKDFEEIIVLSKCRHFIIANSSFSWWAAWLSESSEKIICAPKQWTTDPGDTRDIVPDHFIKIPY
jgi:hypothetical protein